MNGATAVETILFIKFMHKSSLDVPSVNIQPSPSQNVYWYSQGGAMGAVSPQYIGWWTNAPHPLGASNLAPLALNWPPTNIIIGYPYGKLEGNTNFSFTDAASWYHWLILSGIVYREIIKFAYAHKHLCTQSCELKWCSHCLWPCC